MPDTTGHNGFFGLNACHVAPMTAEDVPSYGSPIDVGELGGIIEIQMGAQTSTDTTYATDRAWIDSEVDNGFEGTIDVRCGDLLEAVGPEYAGADVVIANIIADVIIGLAAPVKPYVKEGGVFICSGIAVNRLDDVLDALKAAGYQVMDAVTQGEWSAVAARN